MLQAALHVDVLIITVQKYWLDDQCWTKREPRTGNVAGITVDVECDESQLVSITSSTPTTSQTSVTVMHYC